MKLTIYKYTIVRNVISNINPKMVSFIYEWILSNKAH